MEISRPRAHSSSSSSSSTSSSSSHLRMIQRSSSSPLQRFDSATHFSMNKPAKCVGPNQGSLRDLPAARVERKIPREEEEGGIYTEEDHSTSHGLEIHNQELVSTTMRCKDLRRLVDMHVGAWARETVEETEFADHLGTGLSRLAALCGSSVRSTESSCDPWHLTSCLTDKENRALASLIAELLVREMKAQQQQQQQQQTQQQSHKSSHQQYEQPQPQNGSDLQAYPKIPRSESVPRRTLSPLRAPSPLKVATPQVISSRPRSHTISGPVLHPKPPAVRRVVSNRHGTGTGAVKAESQHNAQEVYMNVTRGRASRISTFPHRVSLPPTDSFWTHLASQGLHPLTEEVAALVKQHLQQSPPRFISNSITTA